MLIQLHTISNERRIDIDFTHIVHDDSNLQPFPVVQDVIHQRGFPGYNDSIPINVHE